MKVNNLPLLELFTKLREAGLPLGVDEYQLILQALQAGFGIPDRKALARLCCTLWVKSPDEKLIFDYHFERLPLKDESFIQFEIINPGVREYPQEIETIDLLIETEIKETEIKETEITQAEYAEAQTNQSDDQVNRSDARRIGQNTNFRKWLSEIMKLANTQISRYVIWIVALSMISGVNLLIASRFIRPDQISITTPSEESSNLIDPSEVNQDEPQAIPNQLEATQTSGSIQDNSIPNTETQSKGPEGTETDLLDPIGVISDSFTMLMMLTFVSSCVGLIFKLTFWIINEALSSDDSPTLIIKKNMPPTVSSAGKVKISQNNLYQRSVGESKETSNNYFFRKETYFPITVRQMKQGWRYLRRSVREGPCVELDLISTIDQIGRQGFFLQPSLVPSRINQVELVLLTDQDGSMLPFQRLANRLADTAQRSGRFGKVTVYYFHNCPVEYIYQDSSLQEADSIDDLLKKTLSRKTVALIFSDAGAARGGLNSRRVKLTKQFLYQLQQKFRYIAWLNPMPCVRWAGTTAEEIAHLVPMFEVNRQGFQGAINTLRGR